MPTSQGSRRPLEIAKLLSVIGYSLCIGCGVKGKPLPPIDPTFIGRGQPYIFTAPKIDENEEEEKKKRTSQ